jgi:hypothetical protein
MIDLSMDNFIEEAGDIIRCGTLNNTSSYDIAKEIWMWMISLKIQIKE